MGRNKVCVMLAVLVFLCSSLLVCPWATGLVVRGEVGVLLSCGTELVLCFMLISETWLLSMIFCGD